MFQFLKFANKQENYLFFSNDASIINEKCGIAPVFPLEKYVYINAMGGRGK